MPKSLSIKQLENLKGFEESFLLFKADWCGYCQEFMPVYKELEKVFEGHLMKNGKPIRFYIFDCTDPKNAMYAAKNCDVEGYPTLKWINSDGELEDYPGGRDKGDIIKYICKEKKVCLKDSDKPMSDVGQVGAGLSHKDLKLIFRTSSKRG